MQLHWPRPDLFACPEAGEAAEEEEKVLHGECAKNTRCLIAKNGENHSKDVEAAAKNISNGQFFNGEAMSDEMHFRRRFFAYEPSKQIHLGEKLKRRITLWWFYKNIPLHFRILNDFRDSTKNSLRASNSWLTDSSKSERIPLHQLFFQHSPPSARPLFCAPAYSTAKSSSVEFFSSRDVIAQNRRRC